MCADQNKPENMFLGVNIFGFGLLILWVFWAMCFVELSFNLD